MKRITLVLVAVVLVMGAFTILPDVSYAQAGGLVPCSGPDCQACHLTSLAQNVIEFLVQMSFVLAALLFAIAGFLFFTGGSSPDTVKKAKGIFTNTIIGIIIVLTSWLVIDIILQTLAGKGVRPFTEIQCITSFTDADFGGTGLSTFSVAGSSDSKTSGPSEENLSGDFYDEDFYGDIADSGFFPESSTEGLLIPDDFGFLSFQTITDIQASNRAVRTGRFASTNCFYAQAGSTEQCADTLAIMAVESNSDPNATNGNSIGLMQMQIATAKGLDPILAKLSDDDVRQHLLDPNTNIRLGNKYYAFLLDKYKDVNLATAAYNGGPKANEPSKDCPGLLKWQCEWDNPEHTVPNEGYAETRAYVSNVHAVREKIKRGTLVPSIGGVKVTDVAPAIYGSGIPAGKFRWTGLVNLLADGKKAGRTVVSVGPFITQEECFESVYNAGKYIHGADEVEIISMNLNCSGE